MNLSVFFRIPIGCTLQWYPKQSLQEEREWSGHKPPDACQKFVIGYINGILRPDFIAPGEGHRNQQERKGFKKTLACLMGP